MDGLWAGTPAYQVPMLPGGSLGEKAAGAGAFLLTLLAASRLGRLQKAIT